MDPKEVETLWSPWRVEYFERERSPDFLFEAAQTTDDAAHFVVARRKTSFLMMNIYPYSVGHLMAVPYRKVGEMDSLGDEEALEIWKLCELAQRLLRRAVRAQGFNVGFNIGKAGGAGVVGHLHLHIVPRWDGDYNFMPVLGQTRIIPEGLRPLYEKLVAALPECGG